MAGRRPFVDLICKDDINLIAGCWSWIWSSSIWPWSSSIRPLLWSSSIWPWSSSIRPLFWSSSIRSFLWSSSVQPLGSYSYILIHLLGWIPMVKLCLHSLSNQNSYSLGGIPMGKSCLHSLTNQNSYWLGGIPMGRSCLHSLFNLTSYGEIVSPFLIESAASDYLPEDSSFTEGSVNLELLLVLFPVLFICFQMSQQSGKR